MAETKSESSSKRVSFATNDIIIELGVHAPLDALLDPSKPAIHTAEEVDKSNGADEPATVTEKNVDEVSDTFKDLAKKKKKFKNADKGSSVTEAEVADMFKGLAKKKKNSKKAGNEIPAKLASAEDPLRSSTTEKKEEVTDAFEGLATKKKKSRKAGDEVPAEPALTEDPLPSLTTEEKYEEDLSKNLTKQKKKKSTKVGDDRFAEPARSVSADSPTADALEPTTITEEQVEEVSTMFKGLAKKKKSKRVDKKTKSAEPTEAEAGQDDGGDEEGGDPDEGTGIWNHNAKKDLKYELLLKRFFQILQDKNPDMMSGQGKSYKIPPPQCVREGNKKTIFANIADICNRMERSDDHVTSYLFAELGTNGSVDASRRLVIKGRFQQKQIENVLRRYIMEYVTCKTCRSQSTAFSKGENRLYFVTCNSCSSRRSVTTVKTGFTAQIGKRKKMQV